MGIGDRLNKIEGLLRIDKHLVKADVLVVIRPRGKGKIVRMTTDEGGVWDIRPGETSEEFERRALAELQDLSHRVVAVCTFITEGDGDEMHTP